MNDWLELVDEVLQGLHHALNNRIGSLAALVELNQLGDLETDAGTERPGIDTLASDVARLQEANRVVRLLPRDASIGEEPLILNDVLADVLAIHRFLHETRDLTVTLVPARFTEPVRVERWALVRVLALLLAEAKKAVRRLGGAPTLSIATETDDQWVRVLIRASLPPPAPPGDSPRYADTLAASLGGAITRGPDALELRLPTLKARRAADRR